MAQKSGSLTEQIAIINAEPEMTRDWQKLATLKAQLEGVAIHLKIFTAVLKSHNVIFKEMEEQ